MTYQQLTELIYTGLAMMITLSMVVIAFFFWLHSDD